MASAFMDQFSSPMSKLVRFFRESRDKWKAKHQELSEIVLQIRSAVRRWGRCAEVDRLDQLVIHYILIYTPTVCALGFAASNCLSTYCKIPPLE